MQDLGESGSVLLVTNNKRQVIWQLVYIIIIINNNNNITFRPSQASDQRLKQLNCCWKV